MSTCAVLLVKDEADVIEPVLRHLAAQVDHIIVADNLSTDGTSTILADLLNEGLPLNVVVDEELAYYQARKTTGLARRALELGHRWVIPCDADEVWYAPEGRTLRDWLDGIGRETQFVKAAIYNHVATALDPPATCDRCNSSGQEKIPAGFDGGGTLTVPCTLCQSRVEPNPLRRIGWRQRVPLDKQWWKVACRLRPDLEIHQGNHSASTQGVGTMGYGLELRHFPYRSADHFVRKAVNGYAAYKAAAELDESIGAHWRVYGQTVEEQGEEAGRAWFYDAFWSTDPHSDGSLVYDPAPVSS